MAYQDIAKLEKFSGKEDNTYSWITDAEKAITANSWDNDHTIQTLSFFLTRTTNSWYQSLAEKPTSFTNLMEDQDFDKSIPMEERNVEQIFQPSKQIKSNIPPAIITEDTILATIFFFDINNLNTHSFFSGAAINQDKPIMALYTDTRVKKIGIKLILNSGSASSIIIKQLMDQLANENTKTLIEEIDNFSFEINGIQIPTKILIMKATQYQALVENDWLSKANAILDWNTQELQLTFNKQYA
ncbi:hypothetical protein G9A89_012888 [Geosiphon pyriformis]|nr:hypothetical protein G9A89_012888 [Geosiphon pyriformis]